MGSNDLSDISTSLFVPIPNLVLLRLTSTNLRSLDFLIHANLTKLQQLLVRKNTFSVISEDVIHSLPSLKRIELMDNNFACDCDNAWFVQWIKKNNQTQVTDAQTFRCNSRPLQKNTKLLDLNVQSCFVDVGFICFISSSCLNILILVASFTYHFSRFQLIYAYYIFLAWLFEAKNKQKRAECRYDAFVSYNSKDEAWVYGELVPHLEQEQGWTLCLHHRDFLPGKPIVENIAEAIYESRKTICVISHRYLQSEWCSKEMQLASFRLFDECEDVLILLFLEDIPLSHLNPYYRMKRLLKKRTYLSWTQRLSFRVVTVLRRCVFAEASAKTGEITERTDKLEPKEHGSSRRRSDPALHARKRCPHITPTEGRKEGDEAFVISKSVFAR
uniref:TIR domain-containing protein n=1 Tax=Knipowitschia caucasica TaxID=637954 RepID=A0AAV2LT79_KNICA